MLVRVWQKNEKIFRCVVRNILPRLSCVEDILQDAFSRVLQTRTKFDSEQDAFAFLRRTVVTTSIDHYRYQRRQKRLLDADPAPCDYLSEKSAGPLDRLLRREEAIAHRSRLTEVRRELQKLPPEQQEAIRIIFGAHDRKIKDVCREAGIPYSTVRSRMLRGVDEIRRQLKRKARLQTARKAHR